MRDQRTTFCIGKQHIRLKPTELSSFETSNIDGRSYCVFFSAAVESTVCASAK